MQPTQFLEELPPTRRAILRIIKARGHATIRELAAELQLVHESVRQQVIDLQRRGWLTAPCDTDDRDDSQSATGRPPVEYCLTPAGDHFFPKDYDGLVVSLIDATQQSGNDAALRELAAAFTDYRVVEHRDVRGRSLRARVESLRTIYPDRDEFIAVERRGPDVVLTEKCCPYLNVALERPIICSTTVSTLRRLLGHTVVRERRFQDGDARCEFHVKGRETGSDSRFELEPPKSRP